MFLLKEETLKFGVPQRSMLRRELIKPGNHFKIDIKDSKGVPLKLVKWEGGRFGTSIWRWGDEELYECQMFISPSDIDLWGGSISKCLTFSRADVNYNLKTNKSEIRFTLSHEKWGSWKYASGTVSIFVEGNIFEAEAAPIDLVALKKDVSQYSGSYFSVKKALKDEDIPYFNFEQKGDTLICKLELCTGKGYSSSEWHRSFSFTWGLGSYSSSDGTKFPDRDYTMRIIRGMAFAIGDCLKTHPSNLIIDAHRYLD